MPDHIHLFIEADPFDSPTNIVKIFKGVTGLRMSRTQTPTVNPDAGTWQTCHYFESRMRTTGSPGGTHSILFDKLANFRFMICSLQVCVRISLTITELTTESDSYSKKGLRSRSNYYDGTHKAMGEQIPKEDPGVRTVYEQPKFEKLQKLESEAEVNAIEDEKPEGLKE
jgi:REP element-mobilizing transposase RayT